MLGISALGNACMSDIQGEPSDFENSGKYLQNLHRGVIKISTG